MTAAIFSRSIFLKVTRPWLLPLVLVISGVAFPPWAEAGGLGFFRSGRIPTEEFSRLIRDFSEHEGDFPNDNLTSNEIAYLHIAGKLAELRISGGAYIGVGPEQNFSYIAKIHPRIVFIVDIRRQAVVQHLLYKAIFHLGKNRAEFLALLFSKPIPKNSFAKGASIDELLDYIRDAPTTPETFLANLKAIRKIIEDDFRCPLSLADVKGLEHIYKLFWHENLSVGYRFGQDGKIPGRWGFPDFKELVLATDLNGKRGNFLAHEKDYRFVRKLQENNRIIPVEGDFAGPKALHAVANYLRENRYTVSAFYTSNVEEYLYENRVFEKFAENISRLPLSGRSVFIRAVRTGWAPHSFWAPNQRITPFLQRISVFLQDYKAGAIPDYKSLVNIEPIAGESNIEDLLPRLP